MTDRLNANDCAATALKSKGYCVVPGVLGDEQRSIVSARLEELSGSRARTRTLLRLAWCRELSVLLRECRLLRGLLPQHSVCAQATYLPKLQAHNWKVGLHRDVFVPVKSRVESKYWSNWSIKEGMWFVQPPLRVLEQMLAVRIHLEANTAENGPLMVVPGSHGDSVQSPRVPCLVPAGGALVMRPKLLHASSKLHSGVRRVVHFLFGPGKLPDGLEWPDAV